MDKYNILTILKTDLQISAANYDKYLENIIDMGKAAIETEGIKLDMAKVEDGMLVEMYAAYLYRKRRGEVSTMPRFLRYTLNNRLMSQKGKDGNG